jgi:anti-sigma B factor antagonist
MASSEGRTVRQTWRLTATSTIEDGETIVKLEGRVGHNGAAVLKRLGEGIVGQGVNRLTLDLSAVDYMSSAGLRTLEGLAAVLEARSGHLRLMNATDPVKLVLDLSGLSERFVDTERRQ